MELKDFIVSAITSLTDGVVEADTIIRSKGGMVNPGTHQYVGESNKEFVHPRTTLNFDIAISATSTKGGDAEASAKIWVVEAKLGGGVESKNESVSRLTFSLDVVLPSDSSQGDRVGKVRRPKS